MNCHLVWKVSNTIADDCPIHINSNLHFIDWIEHIWVYGKAFNTISQFFGKDSSDYLVYLDSNTIFRNWKVQPACIINLAVNTIHDIRYYNFFSSMFEQEGNFKDKRLFKRKNQTVHQRNPLPEGWMKTNVDAFRKQSTRSTSIGYIMKDNNYDAITSVNRRLENYSILVAKCETVREAILMTVSKDVSRIIFFIDFSSGYEYY